MPAPRVIYIANDNYVELRNVRVAGSGPVVYLNNATCTLTLKDLDGVNILGQSWPLTLTYIAASNGRYQGVLTKDLILSEEEDVVAHIEIVDTATGLDAHIELPVDVQVRVDG